MAGEDIGRGRGVSTVPVCIYEKVNINRTKDEMLGYSNKQIIHFTQIKVKGTKHMMNDQRRKG
jgi:hypothetical protein